MRSVVFLAVLTAFWVSSGLCQEPPAVPGRETTGGLEIARIAIARAVEDREPVDEGETFPSDSERLFCFVEVRGAKGETEVTHVWYWKEEEMARVDLGVRSARWRTWSSKRILEHWTGPWRVDVLNPEGTVLRSISFQVSGS